MKPLPSVTQIRLVIPKSNHRMKANKNSHKITRSNNRDKMKNLLILKI